MRLLTILSGQLFHYSTQKIRTKAATKAETEPPPGAEVRAATLITNSLTVDVIKGPSVLGRVYSIILSLKKLRVESSPYV